VIARLLSGVVTQFTSWRNVYWIALGLQYSILIALWLFMPDYPSSNPQGLNYFKMIGGIILLYKKHAVLVQAGLISYCLSAAFTSYWTTLTFLLADPPYQYSPIIIGLFALIGIAGIIMGPVYAKYIIQPYAPLFSCMIGCAANLIGIVIGTYSGKHSVVGPIIQAFTLDVSSPQKMCRVIKHFSLSRSIPLYVLETNNKTDGPADHAGGESSGNSRN
jgi:MFS family permease